MEVTEGYVDSYDIVSLCFYPAEFLGEEHASKNLYDVELVLYNRDADHVVYGYVTIDKQMKYYARTYTGVPSSITGLARRKFRKHMAYVVARVLKEASSCI